MNSKIRWYKEVLELEPGSRVFFPLAKLLTDNGRETEALNTLIAGLERNPEHLEASLLLVDLLGRQGRAEDMDEKARALADKMSSYPAFWRAWAGIMAREGGGRDAAVALELLSAHLSGATVSWADVIMEGLKAVQGKETQGSPLVRSAMKVEAGLVKKSKPLTPEAEEELAALAEEADLEDLEGLEDLREMDESGKLEELVEEEESEAEPAAEESYNLRTRTMADLLAEQGDMDGAVDIYKELIEAEKKGPARQALENRLAELEGRTPPERTKAVLPDKEPELVTEPVLESAPEPVLPDSGSRGEDFSFVEAEPEKDISEAPAPEPAAKAASREGSDKTAEKAPKRTGKGKAKGRKGKHRLLGTLESLAERLEARASG